MSMLAALERIANALPDCMVFSPPPYAVFERDAELEQWLRVTNACSVPIDPFVGLTDNEPAKRAAAEERHITKWIGAIELARKLGGFRRGLIQWKPWHRYHGAMDSDVDAAKEWVFWHEQIKSRFAAFSGVPVIGLSDSEVFDCRSPGTKEAQRAAYLYRTDEAAWETATAAAPNYRYDLGGVRRARRTDDAVSWEPAKWFPAGYRPSKCGRGSIACYHLADPAEFSARLEAAFVQRSALFSSPFLAPPKYGVWITFGQSSIDGGPYSATYAPRRNTAAIACLLREAVEGHAGWIDQICVWMTASDYDSEETGRQLEAFSAGWRLFDSPAEATRTLG